MHVFKSFIQQQHRNCWKLYNCTKDSNSFKYFLKSLEKLIRAPRYNSKAIKLSSVFKNVVAKKNLNSETELLVRIYKFIFWLIKY